MKSYLNPFYQVSDRQEKFDIADYLKPLEALSTPRFLKAFLHTIIDNDSYVKELCKIAYSHQNGFHKYVLYISEMYGWKIRLHVWWDGYQHETDYDIHEHSWDYGSVVVLGKINNKVYTFDREGDTEERFHHYLYEINDETAVSEFTALGIKNRRLTISDNLLTKGDIYKQRAAVFHRVLPLGVYPTATLVFHQQPFQKRNNVYKKSPIATDHLYLGNAGNTKSPTEFIREIEQIIAAL